jgi:hypothetical protein
VRASGELPHRVDASRRRRAPCEFPRKARPRVAPVTSDSHERPFRVRSNKPQVRSARRRTRPGTNPILTRPRELVTWPRVFARLALRSWGLEPTIRRRVRSIEPVPRHRQAATLLADAFAKRLPASRQPHPGRSGGRYPSKPEQDVLPAPPLGGAPRLSRPSSENRPRGSAIGWASETLVLGLSVGPPVVGWADSFGLLPLVEQTRVRELRRRSA